MLKLAISGSQKNQPSFDIVKFPCFIQFSKNTATVVYEPSSDTQFQIIKRGHLHVAKPMDPTGKIKVNNDYRSSKVLRHGDMIEVNDKTIEVLIPSSQWFQSGLLSKDNTRLKTRDFYSVNESEIDLGFINRKPYEGLPKLLSEFAATETLTEFLKLVFDHIKNSTDIKLDTLAIISVDATQHHFELLGSLGRTPVISHQSIDLITTSSKVISATCDNSKATFTDIPIFFQKRVIALLHIEQTTESRHSREHISDLACIAEAMSGTIEAYIQQQNSEKMLIGLVEVMISTIEAKDTYTVGHSERVCRYSMAIADELQLDQETKRKLMISSLCHDIGKIGIPDQILKKNGRLTADEYEEMKLHPLIGANIVNRIPNSFQFISGIKHHHEKWDGTGYPDGLIGEEIPFLARIVAVADVFDAMISGRSYSGFIDESDAIKKITQEYDLFDPDILQAMQRAWDKGTLTLKTSTKINS